MEKYDIAVTVLVFVLGLVVGILITLSTSGFFQQNALASSIGIVASFIAILILNQITGFVGLIRDSYNRRQERKLKPSFGIIYRVWNRDHPLHRITPDIRVLTLRIDNNGGEQVAEDCSAAIQVEGVIDYDNDALNWLDKGWVYGSPLKQVTPDLSSKIKGKSRARTFQVLSYTKNWKVSIRKGFPEYVDILFTEKDRKEVHLFDADNSELALAKKYNMKVTVVAKDMNPRTIQFHLMIDSWETILPTNFSVA